MIKVLEAKPVPRATVECVNCGSLLEYGNADLFERINNEYNIRYPYLTLYYFSCPVCGCEVYVDWINKKQL